MDNFLLKKPNEQTNCKRGQKKAHSRPILEKNVSLSHQLAEVKIKVKIKLIDKSVNVIENSPRVTEKMTQGSSLIRIMLNHKQ